MKFCPRCKTTKPLTSFGKASKSNIGIDWWCKACRSVANKKYRENNTTSILEQRKGYREKNREEIRRRQNEYRAKNRELIRQKENAVYQQKKKIVYEAYENKCNCCGETEIHFLSIDHVNNDGHIHRYKNRYNSTFNGVSLYRWLIENNFPTDNFQILCMNCNFGKGKLGTCPHKLKEI